MDEQSPAELLTEMCWKRGRKFNDAVKVLTERQLQNCIDAVNKLLNSNAVIITDANRGRYTSEYGHRYGLSKNTQVPGYVIVDSQA